MMQLGFALAALAASVSRAPQAQTTSPALTPGAVMLLANSTDPTLPDRLRDALASQDPAVRATAARVAAGTHQTALRTSMIGALAREQDSATGAELVTDLLWLSGTADLQPVDAQARRFGGRALLALAEWLARVQPAVFAERLSALSTDLANRGSALGHLVAIACAQHPSDTERLLREWMAVAPRNAWDTTLHDLFALNGIPAENAAVIVDALASSRTDVRQETVWFVVDSLVRKRDLAQAVLDAARRPREDASAWESFGRDLVGRTAKKTSPLDRHDLLAAEGRSHLADLFLLREATQLTDAERQVLSTIVPAETVHDRIAAVARDAVHGSSTERTLPGFAPGLIASTLAASHCDVHRGDSAAIATIEYAADGSPHHVDVDPTGLSRDCLNGWMALARTVRAQSAQAVLAHDPELVVMPMNSDFVTCVDDRPAEVATQPSAPWSPSSGVREPHKLKNVNPFYPQLAQAKRIQGVVVIEAQITRSGCVGEARVVRTIPLLDIEALKAVSQWLFEPTTIDGSPVPVRLTVTVNFVLR